MIKEGNKEVGARAREQIVVSTMRSPALELDSKQG